MVNWIDWQNAKGVIEYGPGTGVFTSAILDSLQPDASFFAIERSPELANIVRKRCPQATVYEDTVENVVQLCEREGLQSVDAILCGLPWASFPEPLQEACLDAMMKVLKPGGQFVSFAYWQGLLLPAAHRFRRKLDNYFSDVHQSRTVWANLPPAFVYRCTH